MTDPLHDVLLLVWLAWCVQAALSVLQIRRFTRRLGRRMRPAFQRYRPRANVIIPYKGIDDELPANIGALCRQDYSPYRLVCVVESEEDPAWAVLQQELARYPECDSRVLVAGAAGPHQGQKVHNQLCALEVLDRECADDEVWVFADSDAVPGEKWLVWLVGPLRRMSKTAMTSGYRWIIPTAGEGCKPSFWSHLASICNSSVACQLGRYAFNHAWGGSMAIRVSIARRGNLMGLLNGSLADDFQATRMCRKLKLRIVFVPACLVASPVRFDMAGLFGFVRRQYLITRVYQPWLYAMALVLTSLYLLGFMTAVVSIPAYVLAGAPQNQWIWPLAAAVMVFVLDVARSTLRARVIEKAFGRATRREMRRTLRFDRWLTPLWMMFHWLLILSALLGDTMTWRGIRYRLRGAQRTERLGGI